MTLSQLSILTLIAALALFITSQFSRRNVNPEAKIHLVVRGLVVLVIILAAAYIYKRFVG
jgi:hypothetical protein